MDSKNNYSKSVKNFEATLLRFRYSINTVKTYKSCIIKFLGSQDNDVYHISVDDIKLFLEKISLNYSRSTYNQYLNAILFFFKYIHKKRLPKLITRRPRKETKIIEVLSQKEVFLIINSINHFKQKTIISCIYYHGLRVSEVLNLKYSDINRELGLLIIRNGKGKKDRLHH